MDAFVATISTGVTYVVRADLSGMVRITNPADATALEGAGYSTVALSDTLLQSIRVVG